MPEIMPDPSKFIRACVSCRVTWEADMSTRDCPDCKASALFTMNTTDIGFAMYLKDSGLRHGDFKHIKHIKHSNGCGSCSHQQKCEDEFGPIQQDGDDYRALEGTHHCWRSWNGEDR